MRYYLITTKNEAGPDFDKDEILFVNDDDPKDVFIEKRTNDINLSLRDFVLNGTDYQEDGTVRYRFYWILGKD